MAQDFLYLTLKFLHVVASVILLGNFLGLAAWKMAADRSRNPATMAFVSDRIHRLDGPVPTWSGLLVFALGYAGVRGFGNSIANTPFAMWGLILMTLAGLVWYFGMRTLEARMADLAEEAVERNEDVDRAYWRASGTWFLLNGLVVTLIVVIVGLMVYKPDIWPYYA